MLTRDAVVKASLELGQEAGEEALTMRALAAKLGVSATSLYGIFDGKEAILRELRAGAWSGLADALTPALQIPRRRERLRRMCEAYLEFARTSPWLYSLAMEGPLFEEPLTEEQSERALGPVRVAIQALRDGVSPEPSETVLQMQLVEVWASLHGLASLAQSGQLKAAARPAGADPEALHASYVEALVDSLVPTPSLQAV
jgi:AcrR family transcriptional regulator